MIGISRQWNQALIAQKIEYFLLILYSYNNNWQNTRATDETMTTRKKLATPTTINKYKINNFERPTYLERQTHINFKREYDRLVGDISRTNNPYGILQKKDIRRRVIWRTYSGNNRMQHFLSVLNMFRWLEYLLFA